MKVEVLRGEVQEVFPKTAIVKSSSVTLSGKLISERATLKLSFGIGNKILYHTSLVVRPNPVNGLIKNKWAQQKLDFLSIESKKNEEAITKHAKEHKLVTPYTSLIILDKFQFKTDIRYNELIQILDCFTQILSVPFF